MLKQFLKRRGLLRIMLTMSMIVLVGAAVMPTPSPVIEGVTARTTTPVPAGLIVYITNTWAGTYGLSNTTEVVNDAELIPINGNVIMLAGYAEFSSTTYLLLDPIGDRGHSNLFGGPYLMIRVGDYGIQVAEGLYYENGENLYIAGYVRKDKQSPSSALIMSVDPGSGTVIWATVVDLFNGSAALDVTMVHQENKYLAVVGWVNMLGDRQALLMKVDPSNGRVINTYLIGTRGADEEATAVATDDEYEYITINRVTIVNNITVLKPAILMSDWGTFIDMEELSSRSFVEEGYFNDIETLRLFDNTSAVVVVGSDKDRQVGVIATLITSPTGMTPLWGRGEYVRGKRLVYEGVTAYSTLPNSPGPEIVIAGYYSNVSDPMREAIFTKRGAMGNIASFVRLVSEGGTTAVEAFADVADVEYHWLGGNAWGFSDDHTGAPLAGRLGEQFALPTRLGWTTCWSRHVARYDTLQPEVKEDILFTPVNISIESAQPMYVSQDTYMQNPMQRECVAYPFFILDPNRLIITLTLTHTVTVTATEMMTDTATEVVTSTATTTVTETSLSVTTLTCTNEVTTTRTQVSRETVTSTDTVTETVTQAVERTELTYAGLGLGALSLILLMYLVVSRRPA